MAAVSSRANIGSFHPWARSDSFHRIGAVPSCLPSAPIPTPESVARFKVLYLKRFGVALSEQEALDLATRYLLIFALGATPPPRDSKGPAE